MGAGSYDADMHGLELAGIRRRQDDALDAWAKSSGS
ncbi:hypothetical protein SAMN05428939_0130 [Streptomyces sp. TLI_105]|nr:hypothetical protein SAMN05428939_0130 [Streptomyces sp. TLI_105]